MIKSYERLKKLNKEKTRVPKTVQDTIPVDTIYKDGIFKSGNKYTKSYRFLDINYKIASGEDKNNLFLSYSDLLNSFDSSVMTKITINNRKVDIKKFKEDILIPLKQDNLDRYREEYNNMLLDKLSESDDIIQEKYITVTVFKNTIEEARFTFSRITTEFSTLFARLGSSCIELNAEERLKMLHDFYRSETEEFSLDMNDLAKKGHSFKDLITPRMSKYHNKYFEFDGKYGRVLYLSNYPGFLKDEFVSELCDLNKNLMYSMDIIAIPTDEAVREVENKFLGVEKNITDWQMKQNRNNNFSAIIPYDMELQRKECKEFLDDLIVRDQRMMLCNITVVHLADSLEELDKDSETLKAVARKYVCELETLYFSKRQLDGLQTALPIGVNKLNITRTLLTESAAVFIPFRAHEIMQKGGIWYGQNAITNNPILCNKALLQNPNSFVLGIPGSGKSFLTKEEIEFLILSTNDDIIIADPEGEYDPIIKAMQGQIIRIGTNSKDYINAMDMSEGYGDSGNAIADKSQFIMSLFEQLDTNHGGISPIDRSIIDRCVSLVYQDAMKNNYIPTLKHLYNKLLEQSEPEAKSLAIKLELFTNGSLNIFAHETNVDIKSRILSFNIFNLGKQLKTMGLLVITDAIINRVNENWRKGKRTHVFIDEIHVIFENEESATFFASAWRQFRKRDAYPTGITQNVKYLLSSQQGTSMLSNSEFIVMLNQSANDREDLARLLNISEEQMGYITNAPTGSGLIKYGGSIVPFVNKMPKGLLYDLNTTKPGDRKLLFQLSRINFLLFLHTKELMNLRDIKTKQKMQAIKTKDTKGNIQHFIKQQTVNKHSRKVDKKEDASVKSNAQVQATNNVSVAAKQTVIESKHRATKFIKQKHHEYKIKSSSKKSIIEANHDIHPQRISYISKAKKHVVNKLNASKMKKSTEQFVSKPIVQNTTHAIKKSFHIVKKSVSTLNTLFSFGTGLILLIVITLFIGTFSVLAQDGGSNSEIVSLSEEVIAYEDTIRKYAKEYDIEDYVSLLQAIMMQESGGKGNDPMQASESGYNTKYPRVPNGITEPEYSIDVGTHTFSDCVKKANVKDSSDTEHIYLALQGYNYGSGYIEWAISNFGGYSKYNAQQFSDMKKQQLNVSGYGDPYYVDHVMRYVGITFRGGTNPNFNNMEAWITKNPYAKAGLYGQCTWFAWGRFYELYGYDPGFSGNGWDCVDELLKAHPDKFERSSTPKAGAVFSGIGKNHVGIVLKVDGNNITIQDGNYDGITNTFEDAKKDWQTNTYTLDYYRSRMGGIVFANPK